MSLPNSHPLHQQLLHFAQTMLHRRKIWIIQKRAVYDFRDREVAKSRELIRLAIDENAIASENQRWITSYKKIKFAIDKINYGAPLDVSEATASAVDEQQHHAISTPMKLNQISSSEIVSQFRMLETAAFFIAKIHLTPGAAIRSIPHRPGAPYALLPH